MSGSARGEPGETGSSEEIPIGRVEPGSLEWARAKLSRARSHLHDLEASCRPWLYPVEHQLALRLSADARSILAELSFETPPPLEGWALIAGDCVHNIRTALDVFVWMNSTLLPVEQRGTAAYPILPYIDDIDDPEPLPHLLESQRAKDRGWVEKQVEGLPEPLRARVIGNMRKASAFDGEDIFWHQRLPFVRELDDIDKHRFALRVITNVGVATWAAIGLAGDGTPMRPDVDWRLSHDESPDAGEPDLVATGTLPRPAVGLRGSASVALGLRVELPDVSLELPETLQILIDDVDSLLEILSAGLT